MLYSSSSRKHRRIRRHRIRSRSLNDRTILDSLLLILMRDPCADGVTPCPRKRLFAPVTEDAIYRASGKWLQTWLYLNSLPFSILRCIAVDPGIPGHPGIVARFLTQRPLYVHWAPVCCRCHPHTSSSRGSIAFRLPSAIDLLSLGSSPWTSAGRSKARQNRDECTPPPGVLSS